MDRPEWFEATWNDEIQKYVLEEPVEGLDISIDQIADMFERYTSEVDVIAETLIKEDSQQLSVLMCSEIEKGRRHIKYLCVLVLFNVVTSVLEWKKKTESEQTE